MAKLNGKEKLNLIKDRNDKNIEVGDIFYYYEENGEDEASADVGNATYYTSETYMTLVEHSKKHYLMNSDRQGKLTFQNYDLGLCIEDMNIKELQDEFKELLKIS